MVNTIRGASLLTDSSRLVLGSFGEAPTTGIKPSQAAGKASSSWIPFSTRYDAVWSPQELGGGDLRLVIRHVASGLQAGLIRYVGKILLIVLGIALFLTFATMFILDRLVISRVLALREQRTLAGRAFLEDSSIDPAKILMPVRGNDELTDVESAFNQSFLRTYQEMNRRMQAEILAKDEQQRAEKLLLNILPELIAAEMKNGSDLIAQIHDDVSVLFADIVGFTELSRLLPCHDLVSRLNDVVSAFDDL
ncbi:adenylate/guanylate cyclase domain-containing protein [Synechococcus sp. EJ6-Ellesmere]|uniref:adenylate/guanylate cyclase domain-containing protein n=1 Tax=Synechococcus sp. EJ6-Ellesmere TaxID=2823734 RepID=UPI0020CFC365|nr:adenylate/guanylate cyclase domain-containing protein [Synechococcus sp. EJ6-Ellesmere]